MGTTSPELKKPSPQNSFHDIIKQ